MDKDVLDAVVAKAHGFVENGLEVLGNDRCYNLLLDCFEHFSFLGVFFYGDLVLGDDAAFLCHIDADGENGRAGGCGWFVHAQGFMLRVS